MLESTTSTGEKVGEFFQDARAIHSDQSKTHNSIDSLFKRNVKASSVRNPNSSNIYSHNAFAVEDQIYEKPNDCELNTLYHKFDESKRQQRFSVNWTFQDLKASPKAGGTFVTFR